MTSSPQTTTSPLVNYGLIESVTLLQESRKKDEWFDIKTVTVSAFMNCTSKECHHTTVVTNGAQDYYSVSVGNYNCTSVCSGSIHKNQATPVIIKRSGQLLNLFTYQWFGQNEPGISILGCNRGLYLSETCLLLNNSLAEYETSVCSCQGTRNYCGYNAQNGMCIEGPIIWWVDDPDDKSTHSALTTTSLNAFPLEDPNYFELTFILNDNGMNQNQSEFEKNLTIHAGMNCSEVECQYTLNSIDYHWPPYQVLVNGSQCIDFSCANTFSKGQQVSVQVIRASEQLDLFSFQFIDVPAVIVLGCPYGMIKYGFCTKSTSPFDQLIQKSDCLCICQNSENKCDEKAIEGFCSSGNPVWWHPDPNLSTSSKTSTSVASTISSSLKTTIMVKLTEELVEKNSSNYILTIEASMSCVANFCTWQANIGNMYPNYYKVTIDLIECQTFCSGNMYYGSDSKVLVVHRLKQYLKIIEFQFTNEPKLLVMGCENFEQDGISVRQNNSCLHIFQTAHLSQNYYNDDVCLCKDYGADCDDHTKVGRCTLGHISWWKDENDEPISKSSPTTSFTTLSTNTPYDLGRDNSQNRLEVFSAMTCSVKNCEYSMKVDNLADDYFRVFVGNQPCQRKLCTGSFMKGKAVNVTVFRGEQVLDLFDFEYVNAAKIVVLGCEEGFTETGDCLQIAQVVKIEQEDFLDEVCSCQNARIDCTVGIKPVCNRGQARWWRNSAGSSTTGSMKTSTTPTPTTPNIIPSLKELSDVRLFV
uniref:Ig-like domain-containing protein n=1 Tax=Caenorhabditis tropicalis TaxID=1561998 RepID=A0A1I7TYZ5_9PELO